MCVQLRYRKSLMLRKQLEEQRLEGGEGPQWDRLKVSLLKGPSTSTRSSPGTGRNGVSSRALRDSLVHMKTVRRDVRDLTTAWLSLSAQTRSVI